MMGVRLPFTEWFILDIYNEQRMSNKKCENGNRCMKIQTNLNELLRIDRKKHIYIVKFKFI